MTPTAQDEMQAVAEILPDGVTHLIVFDGHCVLCNGFARFMARHDTSGRFFMTTAQGELGQRLYRALGLPLDDFETNLVFVDRVPHRKMASFAAAMGCLGWPWKALATTSALPKPLGDWLYDRIAQNRYRLFGRHDVCPVPPPALHGRLL
jgi:predicted DCC family thiol-disulfide oxidoreductase YuxK